MDMERIVVTPQKTDFLKAARARLKEDGAVVLVAQRSAAHRVIRQLYRDFRFPEIASSDSMNPRIFIDQDTDAWHLLIAPSDYPVVLDARGVPTT
jgi:hypothetical protein